MAKRITRNALKTKLDKAVSEFIRNRDRVCVICGSRENLTNGHIFSRQSLSLRWDTRDDGNCHCQCTGCNYRHEFDAYPYYNWFVERFGKERFDELHQEYKMISKWKNWQLEELLTNILKLNDDNKR